MLAMTQLTFWTGSVSFVTCLALIGHALISWSFVGREILTPTLKPPLWSLVLRAALECVALFAWLAYGLPLLAWMVWIGDNDHWFYHYAWIFAATIAIATAGIAALRVYRTGATPGYLRIHLWLPLILVLSFVAVFLYESLRTIEGATSDSAAQQVFEQLFDNMGELVWFVEDAEPLPHFDRDRCKSYRVLGASGPRGDFAICRHKWYGWQSAGHSRYPGADKELERAKKVLADPAERGPHRAILILHDIVTKYPDTPSAAEAKELLSTPELARRGSAIDEEKAKLKKDLESMRERNRNRNAE